MRGMRREAPTLGFLFNSRHFCLGALRGIRRPIPGTAWAVLAHDIFRDVLDWGNPAGWLRPESL